MEIGSTVRVNCDGYSRRGIIAYINSSDNNGNLPKDNIDNDHLSFDIIYLNNTEESSVISSRVAPLLDLEILCNQYETHSSSSEQLPHEMVQFMKLCGNSLFELKDFDGAYEYYLKAHHLMLKLQELSIGSRVLIQMEASSCYVIGMISGISSDGNENRTKKRKTYEVIYDHLVNDIDEEDNVSPDRLIALYEIPETGDSGDETSDKKDVGLELQRSIFLNLSKCATKRHLKGWAVRWALLAVGLIQGELTKFPKEKHGKFLSDSFFVLSKAFLNSSRPHLAKNAALELKAIESRYTTLPVRSTQLLKEIETFKNQKLKENKILAKNIAEWVDTAMKEGERVAAKRTPAGGDGQEGEDLEVCDDIEADEIRQTSQLSLPSEDGSRERRRGDGGGDEEMKSPPLHDREEDEEKGECIIT